MIYLEPWISYHRSRQSTNQYSLEDGQEETSFPRWWINVSSSLRIALSCIIEVPTLYIKVLNSALETHFEALATEKCEVFWTFVPTRTVRRVIIA